ncbi:MAG: hypothetical protein ACREPN_10450 [Rudaea sp.]
MFTWRWIQRPQNPALRLLLAVLGIVFVVGILVLGFFAVVAFAVIGGIVALLRALGRPRAPAARTRDPQVIEGEYVVVRNDPALKH